MAAPTYVVMAILEPRTLAARQYSPLHVLAFLQTPKGRAQMERSRRWLAAYHVDFIAESFEALGDVDQLVTFF